MLLSSFGRFDVEVDSAEGRFPLAGCYGVDVVMRSGVPFYVVTSFRDRELMVGKTSFSKDGHLAVDPLVSKSHGGLFLLNTPILTLTYPELGIYSCRRITVFPRIIQLLVYPLSKW